MQRHLAGDPITLHDIHRFREAHALPPTFTVAHFEPKAEANLGSIDGAGAALRDLKTRTLAAVPAQMTVADLLTTVETLQGQFRQALDAINDAVGLHPAELDFAEAGFGDVLRQWAYALVRWQMSADLPRPNFAAVYRQWLDDSTRLSQRIHTYEHGSETWQIRILNDAYGRIGLRVTMPQQTIYLEERTSACPAAGYMATLLQAVADALVTALTIRDTQP